MLKRYDFAIVGGGIVGLATAHAIQRLHPLATLVLFEKEAEFSHHQTGHNSGVIHSGIYYKPGSFKARFCRAGNRSMVEFCRDHGIEYEVCGKVIVATHAQELLQLEKLHDLGLQNGLHMKRIQGAELREVEPHVAGLAAIRVMDTGIVNYKRVSEQLAHILRTSGAELLLNHTVTSVHQNTKGLEVIAGGSAFSARYLINCAGLQSDRIAALSGAHARLKIVPFRGEYFELRPERRHLVKHLIYPVPNPEYPFLGVHFTRMIGGKVEAGPNAVLALAREGYRRSHFNLSDLFDMIGYRGFRSLSRRYWREGMREMWRSISKRAFVRSLQRLIPDITANDLVPAPPGIRAQALKEDGSLVDDFHIVRDKRCLHVCNAPSPAATASLEIGRYIAAMSVYEDG